MEQGNAALNGYIKSRAEKAQAPTTGLGSEFILNFAAAMQKPGVTVPVKTLKNTCHTRNARAAVEKGFVRKLLALQLVELTSGILRNFP